MRCVICHSEDVQVMDVKEVISVGKDVVYVNIKTPVCRSCGEHYYDRRTIRYLEKVESELKGGRRRLKEIGKVLEYSSS